MDATDQQYYGRTMSIYMLTWSMMPIAVLPMGVLIDQIGMPMTQAGAGLILAVSVGLVFLLKRVGAPSRVAALRH